MVWVCVFVYVCSVGEGGVDILLKGGGLLSLLESFINYSKRSISWHLHTLSQWTLPLTFTKRSLNLRILRIVLFCQ